MQHDTAGLGFIQQLRPYKSQASHQSAFHREALVPSKWLARYYPNEPEAILNQTRPRLVIFP